ncbi:MAG: 2-octaprenyl-6-methoxyphenyl hydroxylase [Rubrivivax sp.]|nr:2-octaprenyl-6-methoxyphenyl hydroxylase [Rubrivivax sp.]
MKTTGCQIAVVGAGPVGLALGLHAAQMLPRAQVTLFDARPLERDVGADPRTLALSLGSVQFLQRLGAWPETAAQAITEVHVSQQPPSWGQAQVRLRAADLGVPQLGAVLSYGALVAPLQAAWLARAEAEPQRLHTRFGTPVVALKTEGDGVEVDAGIAEHFDLVVVAEGGVFGEQVRKALTGDYGQTAWVGTATLEGATPGTAFERFTRHGPAALLPLPPHADGRARAALVWCVPTQADPVRELTAPQRLAVLNTIFPAEAGRLVELTPLKEFPLGLNAERTLVSGSDQGAGRGRTVRIGNAAQTLHPVAGQGLNLGLRDAHELVAALRWTPDLDRALQRVEWARAPDRWSTIATTDFLARSFTWKLPGAATVRGLGLAALEALPPVKGWLARRMMFGGR